MADELGDAAAQGDVAIDLSVGEISTLCEILGLTLPPVVGEAPWAGASAEVADVVRAANTEALLARRVLESDDDGNVTVNEAVAGILTIASEPQLVMRMSREEDQWVQTRYVAAVPQVSVELVGLQGNVLRIIPFLTATLVERLRGFTGLNGAASASSASATVPVETFEACAEAVRSTDTAGAVEVLVAAGVDAEVAQGLVAALEQRTSSARIDLIHRPEPGSVRGLELAWFESGAGPWVVDPVHGDEGEVEAMRFEPATDPGIVEQVITAMPEELAATLAH